MNKIVVNVKVPGVHRWKTCNIEEVMYLQNYHRHMFHIRCVKPVIHGDRDIEIIMFKKHVKDYLREEYFDMDRDVCFFDGMSCEMIAQELAEQFDLTECEVLEDNGNGAIYTQKVDLSPQIDWSL